VFYITIGLKRCITVSKTPSTSRRRGRIRQAGQAAALIERSRAALRPQPPGSVAEKNDAVPFRQTCGTGNRLEFPASLNLQAPLQRETRRGLFMLAERHDPGDDAHCFDRDHRFADHYRKPHEAAAAVTARGYMPPRAATLIKVR
jgi:hypothetical protein